MNAVTKSFTDGLLHPSAPLTQHLRIWIGTLDLGLDVIENGNVVFNSPGEFRIKAASFTFEGADSMATPLPQLPVSSYQPTSRYSHTQ